MCCVSDTVGVGRWGGSYRVELLFLLGSSSVDPSSDELLALQAGASAVMLAYVRVQYHSSKPLCTPRPTGGAVPGSPASSAQSIPRLSHGDVDGLNRNCNSNPKGAAQRPTARTDNPLGGPLKELLPNVVEKSIWKASANSLHCARYIFGKWDCQDRPLAYRF